MRDQYIPDLTERFPEGFGGVDMTDSYFPPISSYGTRYLSPYSHTEGAIQCLTTEDRVENYNNLNKKMKG